MKRPVVYVRLEGVLARDTGVTEFDAEADLGPPLPQAREFVAGLSGEFEVRVYTRHWPVGAASRWLVRHGMMDGGVCPNPGPDGVIVDCNAVGVPENPDPTWFASALARVACLAEKLGQ